MILPYLDFINSKKIVLGFGSPRRKELLQQAGFQFEISVSSVEENGNREDPKKYVQENALIKATDISNKIESDLIIASDTVVVFNNEILEKPKSENSAIEMLSKLSGNSHFVLTGVVLKFQNKHLLFYEESKVSFYPLSEEFINAYVKTGEPMDKAGSYGIQGLGSTFVKEINGCYYNVMGLPISSLCKNLIEHIHFF